MLLGQLSLEHNADIGGSMSNFSSLGQSLGSGFAQMGGASSAGISKAGGYGALIGAVVDLGVNLYNSNVQKKNLRKQHAYIASRNTKIMQEAMRSLSTISQDRALAIQRMQQAKFDTQKDVDAFRAVRDADKAAAGLYGQSFDAIKNDIARQRSEAIRRIEYNTEILETQYNNQAHALINNAFNQTSVGTGITSNFDLGNILDGLGSSLEAGLAGYNNWQSRSKPSNPALNGMWINANATPAARNVIQQTSGISYNLGLY